MEKCIEVHWTCAKIEEAREVAKLALKAKLCACVQIYPQIESHFEWEEKMQKESEVKVVFKTRNALFTPLEQLIRKNCSYKVPEILAFDVIQGSKPYLEWVEDTTKR